MPISGVRWAAACDTTLKIPNAASNRVVLYPAWIERASDECHALTGFHLFRRSAASIVHALTSDLKLAQELLGHATLATTADTCWMTKAGVATELLASELIQ
jgi:hypothetical protein